MEKTVENNILLAEFLGYIDNGCSEDGFLICPITNYDIEIENLKFHSDWNWLMLVVDKIDKTELSGLTFAVDILNGLTQIICYGECQINGVVLPSNTTLLISESKSRIESTYFACVRFVEWYNENKH